MTHLSKLPENMNPLREAYGIVGTAPVTSFVGNHWATSQLWFFLTSLDLQTSETKGTFGSNSLSPPSEGPKGWRTRSGRLCKRHIVSVLGQDEGSTVKYI